MGHSNVFPFRAVAPIDRESVCIRAAGVQIAGAIRIPESQDRAIRFIGLPVAIELRERRLVYHGHLLEELLGAGGRFPFPRHRALVFVIEYIRLAIAIEFQHAGAR